MPSNPKKCQHCKCEVGRNHEAHERRCKEYHGYVKQGRKVPDKLKHWWHSWTHRNTRAERAKKLGIPFRHDLRHREMDEFEQTRKHARRRNGRAEPEPAPSMALELIPQGEELNGVDDTKQARLARKLFEVVAIMMEPEDDSG